MYLIARESDNILVYMYKNIDNADFKMKLSFADFKSNNEFEYSISEFRRSISYLIGIGAVEKHGGMYLGEENKVFTLSLSCEKFPYIENLIDPLKKLD